ncbi:hypothetical protein Tco_0017050 [Tanacetum coccineum]
MGTMWCLYDPTPSVDSLDLDVANRRRLSTLRTQLGQQQDDMINKINILWKVVSKKFGNAPAHDTAINSMAHVNAASIDHLKKEGPRRRRIKSPSKLLFPKYLSQSSLEEQNRNPSSPKRVQFINLIVILRKESEPIWEEIVKPDVAIDIDYDTTIEAEEEFKKESKEVEEETEEQIEQEEEDNP